MLIITYTKIILAHAIYINTVVNRQDSQGGKSANSVWELSSPVWGRVTIHIRHNVNFALKSIIIKTVNAFHIMLQELNPESALNLPIACNHE